MTEPTDNQEELYADYLKTLDALSKLITKPSDVIQVLDDDGVVHEVTLDSLHNAWRAYSGEITYAKIHPLYPNKVQAVKTLLVDTLRPFGSMHFDEFKPQSVIDDVENKHLWTEDRIELHMYQSDGTDYINIEFTWINKNQPWKPARKNWNVAICEPGRRQDLALRWTQVIGATAQQWVGTYRPTPIPELINKPFKLVYNFRDKAGYVKDVEGHKWGLLE